MLRQLLIGGLAGALIGMAGFGLLATMGEPLLQPTLDSMPDQKWINVLLLLLVWFVAVSVHELGHVVGGLSQGFRFALFIVGPLKVDRDSTTDRIRVGLNRSLELAGGVAGCMPRTEEDLVAKMRWLVIGGPLASVLLTALCIGLVAWRPTDAWSGALLLTGALSGVLGLVTMIPAQNGSFVTDGKRFLQLSRNTPESRRDAALLLYTVRDRAGVPIASTSADQIATMLLPIDGSMHEVAGRTVAYSWLVQHGGLREARQQIARAAALANGLPFSIGAAVALEQAFVAAWFDRDAEAAREYTRPHAKTWALLPASERSRYEAALAIAEGRAQDAFAHIREARAAIDARARPLSGSATWSLARLSEMEQGLG
ncbi:MAG TPA: hypothetical protein VE869_03580 [Gemmatimonas sp.]|nr:hypothetical protein [Gemmatimonas sp.]